MKRNIVLVLVALALIAATVACGSNSNNVTIVNNSGHTICYIRFSPVTQDTWGGDRLGASETVASGSSRSFTIPTGTNYDFRMEGCGGGAIEFRNIHIGNDPIRLTINP
jgi:P pilus assembly chaperone PapD